MSSSITNTRLILIDIAKLQELFISLVENGGIQILNRVTGIYMPKAVPTTILPDKIVSQG
jgi:hypothetical protein